MVKPKTTENSLTDPIEVTGTAFERHPFVRLLKEEVDKVPTEELPTGALHGDIFPDNALWREDDTLVGIIDWEEICAGRLCCLLIARPVCAGSWNGRLRVLLQQRERTEPGACE